MIERLLYIFGMCVLIKIVNTTYKLNEIAGHKKLAITFMGIDSILFLLVFKNVISGELTVPIVFAVTFGYIIGYIIASIIEERVALGEIMITIKISKKQSKDLWKILNDNGFIFTRSKRVYSHKGKPRKMYQGVIFRKELPKLKKVLKGLNFIAYIEPLKGTFGKELKTSKDYIEFSSE